MLNKQVVHVAEEEEVAVVEADTTEMLKIRKGLMILMAKIILGSLMNAVVEEITTLEVVGEETTIRTVLNRKKRNVKYIFRPIQLWTKTSCCTLETRQESILQNMIT